jgi:hypothetical protein
MRIGLLSFLLCVSGVYAMALYGLPGTLGYLVLLGAVLSTRPLVDWLAYQRELAAFRHEARIAFTQARATVRQQRGR